MEDTRKSPGLVATTGDTYSCSIAESWERETKLQGGQPQGPKPSGLEILEANYFKSAQWSPDGTTLLTSSADNTIRTFIVPPTLLDDPSSPIPLTPYTSHTYATPTNSLTYYPLFTLSSPETTLYLSAPTNLPIRLTNALSPTPTPVSTYSLISPTTEAYQTPASVLWTEAGHFLTGTDCLIALFDITRNGEGPLSRLPTIPSKRHKMKGGGVGMRGIVSALSQQPYPSDADVGMLAAGTWTRWVGLYDMGGMGGTVATWSIAEAADTDAGVGGSGVSQCVWSACGRYLCVVERMSGGVLVYDVRVTGKMVAWLEGRGAETNQRLGVDVFESEKGCEIWAGGRDGVVRVWEGVGRTDGKMDASWGWKAHDDPVTSTCVHSSGTVVATCSGQRTFPTVGDDESETSDSEESELGSSGSDKSSQLESRSPDNRIKIWCL